MSGPTPSAVLSLLKSQLTYHPAAPTSTFQGQTILVSGGNAGLGRAAVKLLVESRAEKVIVAVRNPAKGHEAKETIENTSGRSGVIEVWSLDLADYSSVIAFGEKVKTLPRLDAVIENAGVWPVDQSIAEGHELTLTTNVISTFLMAHLILPKLQETATRFNTTTRLTFVGSALHKFASLSARKDSAGNIIQTLDKQALTKTADYDARYNDSKLLLQMYAQSLATDYKSTCITVVNPGYCLSGLKPPTDLSTRVFEKLLARSTEEGAHTLVDAIALDKVAGRNGQYIDDLQVKRPAQWLCSENGRKTSERVWKDINALLIDIVPDLKHLSA